MEWTQDKLNELYLSIQKKAMTDEEYRKELLENATAVIEKEIGTELPEGMKFNVIENDPAYNATFVLPDMLSEELEDEDLEQVAGGLSLVIIITACALALNVSDCAANVCGAKMDVK